VQGALYFPLIRPAASPWLLRALLYWDQVATIVPTTWIHFPERLGAHTLDLVRRCLLSQAFPDDSYWPHRRADYFVGD
jgi:hypothetical protein